MGITQTDIAKAAGVSQRAVAYALSADPQVHHKVGAQTRRRVRELARRMGYVPHAAARRLARRRGDAAGACLGQIGLIHYDVGHADLDLVCLAMMRGAEHELSRRDALLTFVRVGEARQWEKAERLAGAGSIDGWLVYGYVNDDIMSRIQAMDLPCVILGDHACTRPVHCADIDNQAVGRLAARYLAGLGHRRIAYLGGNQKWLYQREMLAGFRTELSRLGIAEESCLIDADGVALSGAAPGPCLSAWLQDPAVRPTALFGQEFGAAAEACRALNHLQVRVPQQMSVLACDIASPSISREQFTRIELPMSEVGRQGAELLLRLASLDAVPAVETRIAPILVEGWSTGRLQS